MNQSLKIIRDESKKSSLVMIGGGPLKSKSSGRSVSYGISTISFDMPARRLSICDAMPAQRLSICDDIGPRRHIVWCSDDLQAPTETGKSSKRTGMVSAPLCDFPLWCTDQSVDVCLSNTTTWLRNQPYEFVGVGYKLNHRRSDKIRG
jgi:hypothetical protein